MAKVVAWMQIDLVTGECIPRSRPPARGYNKKAWDFKELTYVEQAPPPIVYAAQFNACVHETEFRTLSLHLTEAGAKRAVSRYRSKQRRVWKTLPDFMAFRVEPQEIKV